MSQLSDVELNFIREMVSGHITTSAKLSTYANQCKDAKVKQMFQSSAKKAEEGAQKLIDML